MGEAEARTHPLNHLLLLFKVLAVNCVLLVHDRLQLCHDLHLGRG